MLKAFLRFMGAVAVFCSVLFLVTLTFAVVKKVWFAKGKSTKGHVTVVDLKGMIVDSHAFTESLDDALEDKGTKAIVIRIDSPGGFVAPSQEMYQAIREADGKVPVVVAMQALAASGGYYAAVGGRKIYANPGTMTASVGVISEFVNTQKLYQWAKIERFSLKSGKFKDMGSPLKEMTPAEKKLLTDMLVDIHTEFRQTVRERRKLGPEADENYLDGRVMTGRQAKEANLVDVLGTTKDAIAEAKKLGGLPEDADVDYPEVNHGLIRQLLLGEEESSSSLLDGIKSQLELSRPGWRLLLLAPLA